MRSTLLTIGLAVAVMATAAPASATEPLTVVTEPAGLPCTSATCKPVLSSDTEWEFSGNVWGFWLHHVNCDWEVQLSLSGDGTGTFDGFAPSPGDPECVYTTVCADPWEFRTEETAAGTAQMVVDVCYTALPAVPACQGPLTFDIVAGSGHEYELLAIDEHVGLGCEVTAQLEFEDPAFELLHS